MIVRSLFELLVRNQWGTSRDSNRAERKHMGLHVSGRLTSQSCVIVRWYSSLVVGSSLQLGMTEAAGSHPAEGRTLSEEMRKQC